MGSTDAERLDVFRVGRPLPRGMPAAQAEDLDVVLHHVGDASFKAFPDAGAGQRHDVVFEDQDVRAFRDLGDGPEASINPAVLR